MIDINMSNNDTSVHSPSSNIEKIKHEDEASKCEDENLKHNVHNDNVDNTSNNEEKSNMNGEMSGQLKDAQHRIVDDEDMHNQIFFQGTIDLQSERRLARTLGYPDNWHVTRIVPHPSSTSYSCTTFMDIIYCGDPSNMPDCYYNHNAALSRALEWAEGISTGYEGRGGQMLPRAPVYEQDEVVEVNFENGWFKARVVQVKEYDDDIRYTVYYIGEDSTQNNVAEEDIRKRIVKKKKEKAPKVKTPKVKSSKGKTPKITDFAKPVVKDNSQADLENATRLAQSYGLPEGWTAETRVGKFFIQSPDKQHTFRSKRTAHDFIIKQERTMKKISSKANSKKSTARTKNEHDIAKNLGLPSGWKAKHQYSMISPDGTTYSSLKRALQTVQPKSAKKPKRDVQQPKASSRKLNNDFTIVSGHEEDGDPPFRRTGHELLGRRIKYKSQIGKVTGWIKESDVDSTGASAYMSNKTSKPGRLFHVNFKKGDTLFADFEEWELKQLLIEDDGKNSSSKSSSSLHNDSYHDEEDDNDDDSIPLSKMKR